MNALLVYLTLSAAVAQGEDPIAGCRQAHAADPPAHIACLEQALRKAGGGPDGDSQPRTADGFGAEGIEAPAADHAGEPESIAVEIVATRYSGDRGMFEMADGQVWRETEKTPEWLRLEPEVRYAARIERGTLGGYRMYIEGVRRMVKVKRVK